MSQNYGQVPASGTGTPTGTTETAKHEAAEVKDTAKEEAGHVVGTAKEEASAVAQEARSQAKQVYAQTRQELTEQAATQQQRVADGLRAVGDELQSLARGADNPGLATDLVREASTRVSAASTWLSDRDPGSLLHEVKSFARRKPGVFIAGALVAGVIAGRLTRALAEEASDEHSGGGATSPRGGVVGRGSDGTGSDGGTVRTVGDPGAPESFGAGLPTQPPASPSATGGSGTGDGSTGYGGPASGAAGGAGAGAFGTLDDAGDGGVEAQVADGVAGAGAAPADAVGGAVADGDDLAEDASWTGDAEATPVYDRSRAANPAVAPDLLPEEGDDDR